MRSMRCHILLLILGSALAMHPAPETNLLLLNALVFFAALGVSVLLAHKQYEKSWYSCRAVAESVKTATWRYMMRAEPFLDATRVKFVNAAFSDVLGDILASNNQIGSVLGGDECAHDQITPEMTRTRALDLLKRKEFYLRNRIDEQRNWYASKSVTNSTSASRFFCLLVGLQASAIVCVLSRIAWPEWSYWPTDVFIVAAGGVGTWVQLKRFRELAAAYALTAHEIGIIRGKVADSDSDEEFSHFVRDAENAFSREHTQWTAKKD